MKREDLARFYSRRHRPLLLLIAVLALLYFVAFAMAMNGNLQKIDPRWSAGTVIPVITGTFMALAAVLGMTTMVAVPKCPHCKRSLYQWLLHIAIATGNCGYCGKSLDDAGS